MYTDWKLIYTNYKFYWFICPFHFHLCEDTDSLLTKMSVLVWKMRQNINISNNRSRHSKHPKFRKKHLSYQEYGFRIFYLIVKGKVDLYYIYIFYRALKNDLILNKSNSETICLSLLFCCQSHKSIIKR